MDERIKTACEFQQLIHDEQPYTFLFNPYSLNALSERYHNFRQFPVGAPSEIWYMPEQYISGE
jgi:peptide/nickel transport system substrate-binding protein